MNKLVIDVKDLISEVQGDKRLIQYFLKLKLKENNFPCYINVLDISNQYFEQQLCYTKIDDNHYLIEWVE